MAKKGIDLVIEAVRFRSNGQLDFVRAYKRRGATFSDCILLNRNELVNMIQDKRVVTTGKRIPYLGSTFSNISRVNTIKINDRIFINSGSRITAKDELPSMPIL